MSKSSTCSCRMSIVNARTGRHLLLQGRVYPAPETPDNCLTLPSIRFGRCGLALDHFDKEDNAERSLPRALKKPLERYSSEGLTHITVQVTWPSHGRDRAPFGVEIAVKDRRGEALTMAELWRKASSAITDVMKHVAQDDSQEECCWAVSTGAGPGLRRCCVYLVELVHLGGVTYQPELHIAQCESHAAEPTEAGDASSGVEETPPRESAFPTSDERSDSSSRSPTPRPRPLPLRRAASLRSQSVATSASRSSYRSYRMD